MLISAQSTHLQTGNKELEIGPSGKKSLFKKPHQTLDCGGWNCKAWVSFYIGLAQKGIWSSEGTGHERVGWKLAAACGTITKETTRGSCISYIPPESESACLTVPGSIGQHWMPALCPHASHNEVLYDVAQQRCSCSGINVQAAN